MAKEEMLDVELKIEQILKRRQETDHGKKVDDAPSTAESKPPEPTDSDEDHEDEQVQKHQKNGGQPNT